MVAVRRLALACAMALAACASLPSAAPRAEVEGWSLAGVRERFADHVASHSPRTIVVFMTPWCQVCKREGPAIEDWARAHRDDARVVVVVSGVSPDEARRLVDERRMDLGVLDVVVDPSGAIADAYAVRGTPTLIVFDHGVASGTYHAVGELPG